VAYQGAAGNVRGHKRVVRSPDSTTSADTLKGVSLDGGEMSSPMQHQVALDIRPNGPTFMEEMNNKLDPENFFKKRILWGLSFICPMGVINAVLFLVLPWNPFTISIFTAVALVTLVPIILLAIYLIPFVFTKENWNREKATRLSRLLF
jgi:hypothetical protein